MASRKGWNGLERAREPGEVSKELSQIDVGTDIWSSKSHARPLRSERERDRDLAPECSANEEKAHERAEANKGTCSETGVKRRHVLRGRPRNHNDDSARQRNREEKNQEVDDFGFF